MEIIDVTHETFEARIGEVFEIDAGDSSQEMTLVSVTKGNGPIKGIRDRTSFSAVFLCPTFPNGPDHVIATLRNPDFGELAGVAVIPNAGRPQEEWGEGQLWSVTFS